jgi:hypothetical protein
MSFATITPNRGGERKLLFEFCIQQLKKMNGDKPPMNAYVINYPPKDDKVDIVPRVRMGVEMAKKDGFTHVFIVESDDFYPVGYLQRSLDFDFFGFDTTWYYNIRNRTYAKYIHPKRSSLFCTGFKISALDKFQWPADDTIFLDIALWQFASRGRFKVKLLKDNPCLGIKHNIDKVGGKAHRWTMRNKDSDLSFLKSRVDAEAFQFYKDLMLTL